MVLECNTGEIENCTGCRACVAVCPVNAITVKKGRRQETIYEIGKDCIRCGRCKTVCPIDKDLFNNQAAIFYRVQSKDKQAIKASSSGGAAYQFSTEVIKNGGVVYGAGWNVEKQRVEYMRIDKLDDLPLIQGSKYVQSWMDTQIYESIKKDLKNSRVLFTGTPCQIAAVKSYTNMHENLICIDLICHGVPSPDLLEEQLHEITNCKVEGLSFRNGLDFSLRLSANGKTYYENGYDNPYYSLYLNFASLRENCYHCKYACNKRVGDITVGDYEEGGVGYSAVVINSKKGKELFETSLNSFESKVKCIEELFNNHAFCKPTVRHPKTDDFTKLYKEIGLVKAYKRCFIKLRIKRKLRSCVGDKVYYTIKRIARRNNNANRKVRP